MTVTFDAVRIDWLGYATVRLEGETGAVVYMDPGRYGVLDDYEAQDSDLVLVTHGDHYDPQGIRRVAHEDAIVVVHEAVDADAIDRVDEQPEALPYEVERVRADESFVLGPLDLFTTPAYNEPGGPYTRDDGTPYHPEGEGCGFGVTIDGVCAFWPGDSDVLPIHGQLDIDVLLPPIGGSFTMDRHDVATLAETMRPDAVVPIHYNTFDALETDEDAFVLDVAKRGVPVALETPSQ
ncbi:MBL fold metallo-hydrolase [Natronosalvus vescus]|uniref:MBL fold metallo-hydrolase n=1 Tax=Natronosalvus vescus TaxID=2953881 RepID=UPI00209182F0|nr:MBL fold metallo-hydrolase [Natronosalvus vescus]